MTLTPELVATIAAEARADRGTDMRIPAEPYIEYLDGALGYLLPDVDKAGDTSAMPDHHRGHGPVRFLAHRTGHLRAVLVASVIADPNHATHPPMWVRPGRVEVDLSDRVSRVGLAWYVEAIFPCIGEEPYYDLERLINSESHAAIASARLGQDGEERDDGLWDHHEQLALAVAVQYAATHKASA